MYQNIIDWVRNNEKISIFLLVLLFILIRLPGTDLPLHQDEYKWPMIVNPAFENKTEIPHPPLSQFIYYLGGMFTGYDVDFRFIPLSFGAINLVLLYYLVKMLYGRREALIVSLIWVFSYFSVLASLMVDTDGQIMPFFFLLALISYYKLRQTEGRRKYIWLGILIASCVLGFLVKVSFLLAILAIVAEFLWSKKNRITRKDLLKYASFSAAGALGLVAVLFIVTLVFPFFDLSASVTYWKHFLVGDRGWFQTAIQCVKAVLYSSPLLILVPFFGKKEYFTRARPFIFFLFFSFIFYVILFDFSIGALDRYLQLLVLPLSVITAVVIARVLQLNHRRSKEFLFLGIIVAILLILLQYLSHYVPSLHPKSDWIGRIMSFKWSFLYPFSGGSGPLGFYVSFLFISLAWILSFFALMYAKFKPDQKKLVLIFILPICFAYNLVFIEEYLVGHWNGSAPKLLVDAVEYIKNNPDIKMVTVYNDNGGNEIMEIGKYRKRLYVDPKFDINEKIMTLNQYKEHYLVLDVPRIDPASIYRKYLDSCEVIYAKNDKKISAIIYDCQNAPDLKI